MATRLSYLIQKEFFADINVGDIFDTPSIQELAKVIDERSENISYPITENIVKRTVTTPVLASWSQERLWILEQLMVESSPYNIGHLFRIEGDFELETFKQSLLYLIKRHEILRTTFSLNNTKVYQDIKEEIELTIDEISIRKDHEDKNLKELVYEHYSRPFDLSQNCFRVTVIHIKDTSTFTYYLHFTILSLMVHQSVYFLTSYRRSTANLIIIWMSI